MTIPPISTPIPLSDAKPNWIADAEGIAKADITRLEGKLKRVCGSVTWTLAIALGGFITSLLALFKACH